MTSERDNGDNGGQGNVSSVPALVAGLSELQSLLVGTDAIDQVLWETAMLAVHGSDVADECGVTVLREGQPVSLFPNVAPHSDLDEHQYSSGDGPAMQAMTTREAVRVAAMDGETRWGQYPATATTHGVASSLSLPLIAGDQVLGAINFYSATPEAFAGDFLLGRLVADLASSALWCLLQHADRAQLEGQMQQALSSRAEIDQAKGILMNQQRCSPDEAFDLLRRASQNRNVKLHTLATQIVDHTASGTSR